MVLEMPEDQAGGSGGAGREGGRDYSLIDRRSRHRGRCNGWWRFHYKAAFFRPLWHQEMILRWMVRDGR